MKRISLNKLIFFIVFISITLLYSALSFAATVTLTWDYNSEYEKNITGYRLYYGSVSHSSILKPVNIIGPAPYEKSIDIPTPTSRSFDLVLPIGLYYFRMVAYGEKATSEFSSELYAPIGIIGIENFKITITFP